MTGPISEQSIASMFDRIAPRYDLLNRLLSARQDERWRRQMVRLISHRPHGRYLDVATGTGDVLLAAARAHPEFDSFIGIDISRQMLAVAERKVKKNRNRTRYESNDKGRNRAPPRLPLDLADRARFEHMSAIDLEFASETIDTITIAFGLRNVVDRKTAIDEFHRVLKPRGELLILEFFDPENSFGAAVFQFYFHRVLPVIGGFLSDRAAYRYLPKSVGSFYSETRLRHQLYNAGMQVDHVKHFLFGGCRLIKAIKMG